MYAFCPIRIGQYGREIKSPCIFRYQSHSQTGPIYTESHLIIITGNAIVYFYDMLFLLSLQIRTKDIDKISSGRKIGHGGSVLAIQSGIKIDFLFSGEFIVISILGMLKSRRMSVMLPIGILIRQRDQTICPRRIIIPSFHYLDTSRLR